MDIQSPNKPKKFKQTLSAFQKANGNCFLGQERSADGGIHATRDNNIRHVLQNTKKKLCMAIQNKRRGMLTYSVVFLHDNAHPHIAACTPALLEHFNWAMPDHPPYSHDLVLCDYHLFTYLKNWLGSQCFNINEELMESVKIRFSSQAADFFDKGIQKLIPQYDKRLYFDEDYAEK
jgi:hypothetical protein